MAVPDPVYLYHITHVGNLPLITRAGGLRCCSELRQGNVQYTDMAIKGIRIGDQFPRSRNRGINPRLRPVLLWPTGTDLT